MKQLTNYVKDISSDFEQKIEEFEDDEDQSNVLIEFLSLLMILNDIFIQIQEI
ncbi:MAG: hypothetical protein ACTSVY_02590 [Candidatus Helarchaeota archaeon]